MYCPEHIIINRGNLMLTMYGDADIPWRRVPLVWKLNPLRYELILRKPKYIRINRAGKTNRAVSDFSYKHIRPRLCRWFGVHQRFKSRGGDKRCHHCDIGSQAEQH